MRRSNGGSSKWLAQKKRGGRLEGHLPGRRRANGTVGRTHDLERKHGRHLRVPASPAGPHMLQRRRALQQAQAADGHRHAVAPQTAQNRGEKRPCATAALSGFEGLR